MQPFALVKISIALAIKNKYHYDNVDADSNGIDLNRQTITGEYGTRAYCEKPCKYIGNSTYGSMKLELQGNSLYITGLNIKYN